MKYEILHDDSPFTVKNFWTLAQTYQFVLCIVEKHINSAGY
jgi:hypothetical protein